VNIFEKAKRQKKDIIRIAETYGAHNVRIFGSASDKHPETANDLDLLVELETGRTLLDLIAIQQDIEDLLNYKVDVVTLASLSPYIRDNVLAKAVEL
jgi:uncharacterized protein